MATERWQPPQGAPGPLGVVERLGRFELLARLGSGGMGTVFRARDSRLGRDVAIKVIARHFYERADAMARFEREARAASALNHPNIVTIFDIGEHDGFPFIVMELVPGQSLRELLAGGPLPLERGVAIATQIARGLTAAHETGIVHRDLKPENVLVAVDGGVKMVDFGLAQFHAVSHTTSLAPTEDVLTATGAILGTAGYTAPEIISGKSADHRTDHFSFGAMLYEITTGRRTFPGGSTPEVLAATLRDDPAPLSSVAADIPESLENLIRRCLSKAPEGRYDTTRELVLALENMPRAVPVSEPSPPPQAMSVTRAGLPAALTPLIGRDGEVAQVESLLRNPDVRLVTITGLGGCGKTRVALQVAENMQRDPGRRVAFVPLGTVHEPELVPLAIARELGIRPGPGQTELDAVVGDCSMLASTLLLLDNFEHLMEAAQAVSRMLASCPTLKVLVTSREVLHLSGEHDFHLSPLALPDSEAELSPEDLARVPAVALFVDRARAVSPGFTLDEETASAVVDLCARLDGLPLALELAAARSRILSPQAMLARLGSRLQLRASVRDLPGRQQTLRRTIDWSHDLLDANEQAYFRRLGVFVGGFTLEAAQSVVDPFEGLELDVVEGIASLVDKSLVTTLSSEAGEERYGILETVREYALERLEASSESERTRKAHAAYCLVLAEEGGAALATAEDPKWILRLDTEHDNLRAALGWLTARGDAAWGLRMALGLFHFWERAEHLTEGRRRFEELLRLPGEGVSESTRARAVFCSAILANTQGRPEEAEDLHRQSLEIYRAQGDLWGQAVVLNALSTFGDPELAKERVEEALALWQQLGDDLGYARSLCNLAMVLRRTEHYDEARAVYHQAAELFAGQGDRGSRAWALNHEGDLARELRDFDRAEALYREALGTFRELGEEWGIGSSLADLGTLEKTRGDLGAAAGLYRRALSRFHALGHRRGVARLFEALASLAVEVGDAERALLLASAARSLRDRVGAPLGPEEGRALDQELERARRMVGERVAEETLRRGRRLSLDAVVEEALREAET